MTLQERCESFKAAFPDRPASWPYVTQEQDRDVIYGRWLIGQDYTNGSKLYGSYPHGYLDRLMALYPDIAGADILHAFSGSLPPGDYSRVDLVDRVGVPDLRFHQMSVYDVAQAWPSPQFRLVAADPIYSREDAKRYGTPPVDRFRATAALASVTHPGGFCAWLDTCWPMHNKSQWVTVGRIAVTRSTNHRLRDLSIFERVS